MSEKTNDVQEEETEQITPAEYKKLRLEAQKELKEEIKFLKTEDEYQSLLASIEENKLKRMVAISRQAQLMQGPQQPTPQNESGQEEEINHEKPLQEAFPKKTERKLKTED